MSFVVRSARSLALFVGGLLCVTFALSATFPRLTAFEHRRGGHSGPVVMPWRFDGTSRGNRLEVHLRVHWWTPRTWTITPDDHLTSLRINGVEVPLDDVPASSLNDWERGFEMDLAPWLHGGDNTLELVDDNSGGAGGISLRPAVRWRSPWLCLSFVPWLVLLARAFGLRRAPTAVLFCALAVISAYWAATPWLVHSYDVKTVNDGGHLGYVVYVAEHASLPKPDTGWEFYQPPAYYVGGALVWRGAERAHVSGPQALQAYSLALWLVFLVASSAALQASLPRRPWPTIAATGTLALWPCAILHAPRIGNDAALYAAAGLATWFMVRWWRSRRAVHLVAMSLATGLALLSKSSGAALVVAALTLLGLRMVRERRWRHAASWREVGTAVSLMALGAALSSARNIWYWSHGKLASWLVGSIGTLDPPLRVPNDLSSYVPLKAVFFTSPWLDSRDDATGRANFWNYLLRSSLTGEFAFDGEWRRDVGLAWGVLLFSLLTILALAAIVRRPSRLRLWKDAPWYVLSVAWLASVLASRILYPFSCQGDFRFVVPLLVPLALASVRRGRLTQVLAGAIAVGAAAFFVSL